MMAVTIREVLEQKGSLFGWLYLPNKPWKLETQGLFIQEDKDSDPSDPFPPTIIDSCHLSEVLDAAGIEDIIANAEAQIEKPTVDDLYMAFLFYVENDAFIEFKK